MKPTHKTRESWLMAALQLLKPLFTSNGYKVPEKVRVSCGFPSRNPLGQRKRAIGECWSDSSSKGKVFEIFISPTISKPLDVIDTLVHEIVHATVGLKCGHKGAFKVCALKVGLEGKMTQASAGAELKKHLEGLLVKLGVYPHDTLDGTKMTNGKKPEGCRLLKASCPECTYVVRVTRKWLDVAIPTCPNPECGNFGEEMVEGDTEKDG